MSRGFNPADYDTVESRLAKFWADHPQGRVLTELVHSDGKQYIVRADVYTDRDDTRPATTGYAEEVVGSTPVNKTSALENCETSAIGRALANLNYATKARPSQTEMEKAHRQPPQQRQAPEASGADEARRRLASTCKENGWDLARVAGIFENSKKIALKDATDVASITKFREYLFTLPQADLMATNGAAA
jgi:hypothetical protein